MTLGLILLLIAVLLALLLTTQALATFVRVGVPYVGTNRWVVRWLQDQVALAPGQTFFELGCGDGRVLIALARRYPKAHFVGFELAWWPWLLAKASTRRWPNIRIERQDFLTAPLQDADVVYCYLITEAMARLGPLFEQRLKPGAIVYSYAFRLPGWTLAREVVNPKHPKMPRLWVYRKGVGSGV